MALNPPPTQQPIIVDPDGANSKFPSLPWIIFFNALFSGDAGTVWVPTFENLTEAGGAPEIIGQYFTISQFLSVFFITITPPSGGSTSAVAGTTACTNYPPIMNADGFCVAVAGGLGGGVGMCQQEGNLILPPSWTTVTNPLTIIGIVQSGQTND